MNQSEQEDLKLGVWVEKLSGKRFKELFPELAKPFLDHGLKIQSAKEIALTGPLTKFKVYTDKPSERLEWSLLPINNSLSTNTNPRIYGGMCGHNWPTGKPVLWEVTIYND